MIKIHERLDELMFENSINADALGKAVGVSKTTIYRYLKNIRMPNSDILIKLANFFNCSLDFLMGLTEFNKQANFKTAPIFSEQFKFILDFYKTTEYFAHKNCGISRSVLFSWLSGNSLPSAESLAVLAKHFNCSLDFLTGRES